MLGVICWGLSAQAPPKNTFLSIGYIGQFAYQTGAKIGAQIDLNSWTNPNDRTLGKSWFVSPQLGLVTRPEVHTSYLANVTIGIKRYRSQLYKYAAVSMGFGYLLESRILDRSINLSDGTDEKNREQRSWFIPTLNFEFGRPLNQQLGWYARFSGGPQIGAKGPTILTTFFEFGIHHAL